MSLVKVEELETKLFINNEFVNSQSGKTFPTVNPATEEIICEIQEADAADVNKAVSSYVEKEKAGLYHSNNSFS